MCIYSEILSEIIFTLAFFPTFYLAFYPESGIYVDLVSGIYSGILPGIYFDILSGILSGICSDVLSWKASGPLFQTWKPPPKSKISLASRICRELGTSSIQLQHTADPDPRWGMCYRCFMKANIDEDSKKWTLPSVPQPDRISRTTSEWNMNPKYRQILCWYMGWIWWISTSDITIRMTNWIRSTISIHSQCSLVHLPDSGDDPICIPHKDPCSRHTKSLADSPTRNFESLVRSAVMLGYPLRPQNANICTLGT